MIGQPFGGVPRKTGTPEPSRLGVIHGPPVPAPRTGPALGRIFEASRPVGAPTPRAEGPFVHPIDNRLARSQRSQIHIPRPPPPPPGDLRRRGIAFVGFFRTWPWGQHPDEAYMADAVESLGVPVYRMDQDSSAWAARDAAWVVFTAHPASRGHMPEATQATVLWTLDWLPYYTERRPVIDAARQVTLLVTSDRYDWGLLGIHHQAYLPAACETIDITLDPRPSRKCAFMGSLYSDRRKKIARIVEDLGGEVRGAPGAWLYGRDLAKYVQETKVVVGDNAFNDVPGYWSSRNYVIPGAGGFLLTPRVPGLEEHLADGVHAVLYDPVEPLAALIERWAADDGARERIRLQGASHVREHHNWTVRAGELVSILEAVSKRAAS